MSSEILDEMSKLFTFGREPGIGRWLATPMHNIVRARLEALPQAPLSKVQLNQLLVISEAASISDGFFMYYWRSTPEHPYHVKSIDGFDQGWFANSDLVIVSLEHLRWGLYGLLYFGNVRAGFDALRSMNLGQITEFFRDKRFDTEAIAARGPALELHSINRDDRHQISEMACKTFGDLPEDHVAAFEMLNDAWMKHEAGGGGNIGFRALLEKYVGNASNKDRFALSYDEVAEEDIDSKSTLKRHFDSSLDTFLTSREKAIKNTEIYLSMVNDLDVYVATSMRSRQNFRDMASACELIFSDLRLCELHLRYFDPTMSAARGHEDKGLIECLW